MIVRRAPLDGVCIVEQERFADERGFFARTYDVEALGPVVQMSTSFNARAGTLRGLHFQAAPHEEAKLVRCTRGALFDVVVDVRRDSPTRHRWHAVELTEVNGLALFIPAGFAHGFQTLVDETEVLYAMSTPHVADAARGLRWDDPAFGIEWPEPPAGGRTMSPRDASYPGVGE
jgi:dTDP-4-dehydrorhamnose 3,5-epimerase